MQSCCQPARRPRRFLWVLLGLVVVLGTLLFSGCGPQPNPPLTAAQMADLGAEMARIENTTTPELIALRAKLVEESNLASDPIAKARANFLIGYLTEFVATAHGEDANNYFTYGTARQKYTEAQAGRTAYTAQAAYRLGVLGVNGMIGPDSNSVAKAQFRTLSHDYYLVPNTGILGIGQQRIPVLAWERTAPGLPQTTPALAGENGLLPAPPADPATLIVAGAQPSAPPAPGGLSAIGTPGTTPALVADSLPHLSVDQLDTLYKTGGGWDAMYYHTMAAFVGFFRNAIGPYGPALALILLALIIKLVTIPLTTASFRGMRDMQRIQPLIKELQEKYKDDKQKLGEEQMKLMKEHNVNVMGGCLPMLIQIPIFILLFQAVNTYIAGFRNAPFLWIPSLSDPDQLLLVLYLGSMVITQKLTATPSADPAAKQQQQIMTWMMPIMLALVLASQPSAFLLYWFFLNVFSSAHQYYLMRKFRQEEAAAGLPSPADQAAPKGTTPPRSTGVSSQTKKKGK